MDPREQERKAIQERYSGRQENFKEDAQKMRKMEMAFVKSAEDVMVMELVRHQGEYNGHRTVERLDSWVKHFDSARDRLNAWLAIFSMMEAGVWGRVGNERRMTLARGRQVLERLHQSPLSEESLSLYVGK